MINEYETKESKNKTGMKNFKPKINQNTSCTLNFLILIFQLFSQFDADGEGFADVETFLEVGI